MSKDRSSQDAEYYKKHRIAIRARQSKYYVDHKDDFRKRNVKFTKTNPSYQKEQNMLNAYGLSLAQYNKMIAQQNNKCCICKTAFTIDKKNSIHIDHDHESGKVRGILCSHCNVLLGYAREDISILRSAIRYITKHKA